MSKSPREIKPYVSVTSTNFTKCDTYLFLNESEFRVEFGEKSINFLPKDIKGISSIPIKRLGPTDTNVFRYLFMVGAEIAAAIGAAGFLSLFFGKSIKFKLRLIDGRYLYLKSNQEQYFKLRNMLLDDAKNIVRSSTEIVRSE